MIIRTFVITVPDNEMWVEDNILEIFEEFNILYKDTGETRDLGFGLEQEYVLQGEQENLLALAEELDHDDMKEEIKRREQDVL